MSGIDDQSAEKKQIVEDNQNPDCNWLYEVQCIDSNQSIQTTKEICEIIIQTDNDQNTSNLRHTMPARMDNKAAERSRLYRQRHRDKINERRRSIRQRQQILHQLLSVYNEQNTEGVEQINQPTSNNRRCSNSHIKRQQRYYERHKEEINKRKRDKRQKQNISPLIPATGAERNRIYRERHWQEINERRRYSRLRKKLQTIHKEYNKNNIDVSGDFTEQIQSEQQTLNSLGDDIKRELQENIISSEQ